MRRVFALPVLAIALFAAAGVAVAGDVNGPKCADITTGDAFYSSTGTVDVTLHLAGVSCSSITYTLVVLDEATSTFPLAVDTERGDGSVSFVQLQRAVNDDDSTVCIYATTSTSGGRVFDRAPDTGCASLTKGGSGGGSGFS